MNHIRDQSGGKISSLNTTGGLNMTEQEIRDRLINNCFALSNHVMRRVEEQNLYNIHEMIGCLARNGEIERGFNRHGLNWTIDGDYRDRPYRLVVGPHLHSDDILYIISLFKVLPGIEKGQNYRKYSHRELVLSFTHAA